MYDMKLVATVWLGHVLVGIVVGQGRAPYRIQSLNGRLSEYWMRRRNELEYSRIKHWKSG